MSSPSKSSHKSLQTFPTRSYAQRFFKTYEPLIMISACCVDFGSIKSMFQDIFSTFLYLQWQMTTISTLALNMIEHQFTKFYLIKAAWGEAIFSFYRKSIDAFLLIYMVNMCVYVRRWRDQYAVFLLFIFRALIIRKEIGISCAKRKKSWASKKHSAWFGVHRNNYAFLKCNRIFVFYSVNGRSLQGRHCEDTNNLPIDVREGREISVMLA